MGVGVKGNQTLQDAGGGGLDDPVNAEKISGKKERLREKVC